MAVSSAVLPSRARKSRIYKTVGDIRVTEIEREMLIAIAEGLTDHEIAARRRRSVNTTHNHVQYLLRKTRMSSRTACVIWALRAGIFALDDVPVRA